MSQSDRTSFVADAAAQAAVREGRHPATFDSATLILIVMLSVFGAAIGVQLIGSSASRQTRRSSGRWSQ
jgi:hypothetical protein